MLYAQEEEGYYVKTYFPGVFYSKTPLVAENRS